MKKHRAEDTRYPSSFTELVARLKPGGTLIVAPRFKVEVTHILQPVLRSLGQAKSTILVTPKDHPSLGFPGVQCHLLPARSSAQLTGKVRQFLRKHPRRKTVILDAGHLATLGLRSEQQRCSLLLALADIAAKLKYRLVCFVARDQFSPPALASLKDSSSLFLHIERTGPEFQATILSAKGLCSADLYLPRVLMIADGSVAFRKKEDPVPTSPGDIPRLVFEKAALGYAVFDYAGRKRTFNPSVITLLGYAEEELHVLSLNQLVSPGKRFALLRMWLQLKRRRKVEGECTLRKKNGKEVHVAIDATEIASGIVCVAMRDITAEKKRERDVLARVDVYRKLADGMIHPVFLCKSRRIVYANRAFRSMFDMHDSKPVTVTEFFGKTNASVAKAVNTLEMTNGVGRFKRTVTLGTATEQDKRFELSAFALEDGLTNCTLVDVTEREDAVVQLQKTAERFSSLFEGSAEAISVVADGKIIHANRRFLELFGFSSLQDVEGKEATPFGWINDEKGNSRRRSPSPVYPRSVEFEVKGKHNERLSIEALVNRIAFGGMDAEVFCHRDISERKHRENELRERARNLALVDEITRQVHSTLDMEEVLRRILRSTIKGLSQEFGGIYHGGDSAAELVLAVHEGLSEKLLRVLERQNRNEGITGFVVKTHEPLVLTPHEYPAHLPYRSLFEGEKVTTAIYLPLVCEGMVVAILMLGSRKPRPLTISQEGILHSLRDQLGGAVYNASLFRKISASERLYRQSVENISDIIYHAKPSGEIQFVSPNVERVLGYAPAEFYRSPELWRSLLHPDDRTKYSQRVGNRDMGADDFHLEYRVLPKGKAAYLWVRDAVRYHRDGSGQVIAINGVISDVTDRVHLEAALVKSEGLKTNVLESVQEGVMVLDRALTYIDWNAAMEQVTGIARSSVIGRSASEVSPRLFTEDMKELLNRALNGEAVSSEDIPIRGESDGNQRFLWARYSPLRDATGSIRGVVGILTDITNRKKLEQEVRESEETLRNVIDAMGDALMISDLQGRVWEVNKEFTTLTGFTRSEVLGQEFPYPWVLDEEMAKFVKWIAALRERSYLRDFDMTWRRKDGYFVAISLNTTMLRNAVGEPVAMLNIARDISERQRLSRELSKRNRQIELLNRIISKTNTTMDFGEIFETIASEVLTLIPYDQINVGLLTADRTSLVIRACSSPSGFDIPAGTVVPLEQCVSRIAIRDNKPLLIPDLWEHPELLPDTLSIQEGLRTQICIPFHLHGQILGTFCLAARETNAYSGEELRVLQPIADQIGAMVDRVRLFRQVSDDSEYIHNLVNSIDSVVFTVDENYHITEANRAWREFAIMQGLEEFSDETVVVGKALADVTADPNLLAVYHQAMPDLFARRITVFSHELDLKQGSTSLTYQLVITPMTIGDKVTGLVFTFTDVTNLKRNEEQLLQRNKELMALNTISRSISTSLDLDAILRVACEQIRDIVRADIVLFYLRDEQKQELVLERSVGLDDSLQKRLTVLPTVGSATGTVIASRQPLYIQDRVSFDDRVTTTGRAVFKELNITSLGVIPLQSKDRVLGAMDVAFKKPHDFPGEERRLLLLIGNQIGSAIENAQLYTEVQSQVQRITALYELGKSITGALDTTTLLRAVASEIWKTHPVDQLAYYRILSQPNQLRLLYERSGSAERVDAGEDIISLGDDSPLLNVLSEGVSVRENNAASGSFLAAPINSGEIVRGLLVVSVSFPGAYSVAHLRLFQSIANLVEIAMERARLYEDTIAKSLEIEARNKELDDFTYVVSHDLKEPLISIEGYGKILLKEYESRFDQEGKEYLASIIHSTGRMKGLIDDLLTLSRLGRMSESVQLVDAGRVLGEILHELRFMLQEKHVVVNTHGVMPEVRYNPTQLGMVFRNLISNALKFNDKPEPRVTVSVERREKEHLFSVSDNGIGIDERYFEKIFIIFQRLQRNEEYRGTGAGLTIVKKIVEKHGGRIWVESKIGEGTTFFFTVPS